MCHPLTALIHSRTEEDHKWNEALCDIRVGTDINAHTHTNMREFSSCTAMHQFNILHFKNTHLKQSFSV